MPWQYVFVCSLCGAKRGYVAVARSDSREHQPARVGDRALYAAGRLGA
jgi:hypothetical protein